MMQGNLMSLSRSTVETLIDLVEIKLSCVEVYDRDDNRELNNLRRCKEELMDLAARTVWKRRREWDASRNGSSESGIRLCNARTLVRRIRPR